MGNLNIPNDALERLRMYTLKKHGKLRGVLAEEAKAAVEAYLNANASQEDP